MSDPNTPVIKVLIKPLFDSAHEAISLSILFVVDAPKSESNSLLISLPASLRELRVEAEDGYLKAIGSSNLPAVIEELGIRWMIGTSRKLKLSYEAVPESLIGLHYDQGGILGSGLSFIPLPQTDQIYQNIVEWDLSQAPEGTRAVWTFGEGPSAVEKAGPASILSNSVYMIGLIHSNPPASLEGTASDHYGYYWFGDLPPNIAFIKDIHHDFFVKVSDFFQDPTSAANPYRSFVLSTSSHPSFGGTNHIRSHIFSYDSQISVAHDYDLIRRMAYEIIDNFVGPSPADPSKDWLLEGIKNTLSIYLPFRTGFRTPDYFQSTMTMQSMKYYTNPLINLTHDEAVTLAPGNPYARELISSRAWAFVILTDFRSRVIAEKKRPDLMPRPMEDLAVKPLASKKQHGEPHGIDEWLELLQPLMEDEIRQLFEHMKSGKMIMLPEKFFGSATHRMAPIEQEMLDFGMDRESFETGFVKNLTRGSRAEEAGLREGDRIIRSSPVWKCIDHFKAEMEVVIEKNGIEKSISYWPRSFKAVESREFVKLVE